MPDGRYESRAPDPALSGASPGGTTIHRAPPAPAPNRVEFSFVVHTAEDTSVIALRGELCPDATRELDAVLRRLCTPGSGSRVVVLELSSLRMLSAAGISLVVEHRNRWGAHGGTLVLSEPRGTVAQVLELCQIPLG